MLSPRGMRNRSYDWDLNILFNKNQISHLRDKVTGQNPHPSASEGGQMSFKDFKPWSSTIKIPTLGTNLMIKLPWLAQPPPHYLGLNIDRCIIQTSMEYQDNDHYHYLN